MFLSTQPVELMVNEVFNLVNRIGLDLGQIRMDVYSVLVFISISSILALNSLIRVLI